MSRRRIVLFSALYMPHLGGVEKFTQSISAELSKDSQVTVFCMNTEDQPAVKKEGEVTVYFLPCFPLQKGRFPIPKPSALRIIREKLSEIRPDFAIVQCRFYLLSYYACYILNKKGIPFIQIEHGAGDIGMQNPIVNWVWHCYDRILTALEKRIPHDYYAVSYAGLRWLEHYEIKGVGVISNSIRPQDFTDAVNSAGTWRKAHNIPDNAVIITFSGRIMRDKGILDLLEAFEQLSGEDLYLVVAGGGDMKLIQPWQGRERILFLGQIAFSEIPHLLADTQIYCLPSHFIEGKPTGVLEAGYCRNAVISTDSGGTTEIIPDERYGKLIPAGDIPALTAALQFYIDHPEERRQAGINLKQYIQENFTWETAAKAVYAAMTRYGL